MLIQWNKIVLSYLLLAISFEFISLPFFIICRFHEIFFNDNFFIIYERYDLLIYHRFVIFLCYSLIIYKG